MFQCCGPSGGVFEDTARVTARLAYKDPGTTENPTSPISVSWITLTRYRVVYVRADGKNTPGADVPYPFDGGITFTTVDIGFSEFTLVRAHAKLEPSLMNLWLPRRGRGDFDNRRDHLLWSRSDRDGD